MATNPMQRKANNYLLIGVLVTLLITGSIIAILFMQYMKLNNELKETKGSMTPALVAGKDIKSGEIIDTVKTINVPKEAIPANTLTAADISETTHAIINLQSGTVITSDMVYEEGEEITDDVRIQEYNMIQLPTQMQDGDYIDIRLRLPNGTDYIVVSKKKVTIPTIDGVDSANTIRINMSEDEILLMSNAIVEAYWNTSSILYATTYALSGEQQGAIATYLPNDSVWNLVAMDPNIVNVAAQELAKRYYATDNNGNSYKEIIRSHIDSSYTESSADNIRSKVEEELSKAKEERQAYLDSLGGI